MDTIPSFKSATTLNEGTELDSMDLHQHDPCEQVLAKAVYLPRGSRLELQ